MTKNNIRTRLREKLKALSSCVQDSDLTVENITKKGNINIIQYYYIKNKCYFGITLHFNNMNEEFEAQSIRFVYEEKDENNKVLKCVKTDNLNYKMASGLLGKLTHNLYKINFVSNHNIIYVSNRLMLKEMYYLIFPTSDNIDDNIADKNLICSFFKDDIEQYKQEKQNYQDLNNKIKTQVENRDISYEQLSLKKEIKKCETKLKELKNRERKLKQKLTSDYQISHLTNKRNGVSSSIDKLDVKLIKNLTKFIDERNLNITLKEALKIFKN